MYVVDMHRRYTSTNSIYNDKVHIYIYIYTVPIIRSGFTGDQMRKIQMCHIYIYTVCCILYTVYCIIYIDGPRTCDDTFLLWLLLYGIYLWVVVWVWVINTL